MRRTIRLVSILVATLALVLGLGPTAHADDDDTPREWRITRYDAQVDVAADGLSTVRLEFDFHFGNSPGHGPFITLPRQQEVADDPDVWRMIDIDITEVSSPTGAPVETQETTQDGSLVLRVGREGTRVRGTQTYVITYTAHGLLAPRHATSGLAEFNWNVIGTGWQVPIDSVTARVTGPADVVQTACFSGSRFDQACKASNAGPTASFAAGGLEPGEGVQVVAGFPVDTFVGAEPRFTKRYHLGNVVPLTPLSLGLTGALTALGIGGVLLKARRWSRDEVYLGLTPGVRPAPGEAPRVGLASEKTPVAVQFTPPPGAHVGEVGVLLDTRADNVDVTATILDLAARGHYQIVEDGTDWRFVRRRTDDPLTPPERHIVDVMFSRGNQVSTSDLRHKRYHKLLSGARERLQDRVTNELRWFKGSPQVAQGLALAGAALLVVAGLAIGAVLGFAFELGLVGLAPVIAGLVLAPLAFRAGRRTAEGSAVLAQAKGFELYLRTAEADQIRFEEGIDVFSRYLPWATIFGVADRWAKVFEQLAAEGRYTPTDDWYVGHSLYQGAYFTSAMNNLTHTLSESMQAAVASQTAATAGSSGGSGFSGGGGFGGGGGGGW
ncbi:DUF2207 domain-containing protein [Propioniciclava sinopodophylli]|uniref:DUF2207 domain-containing protein n=1 Tax=Propioniciclava sinopodophylli TaxID=1837344 RepID=UPI00249129E2|nr:DUF2207 domain-containing protein [Propioniciclava sinopodophylli]